MVNYTLGFIFDESCEGVWLIKKSKGIQKEKYNGIGGKIEKYEVPLSTMERESIEECNYNGNWINYGMMYGNNWQCHLFYSIYNSSINEKPQQQEKDHPIYYYKLEQLTKLFLNSKLIHNVPSLVYLALSHMFEIKNNINFEVNIQYFE
jgi:8-oxo-dGTP pyrophosphatase MutT (NUDIX family)